MEDKHRQRLLPHVGVLVNLLVNHLSREKRLMAKKKF
jgi:hypothetical protein